MKSRQIHTILRNFNTPLSIIDKTRAQEISKGIADMIILNRLDLFDICRMLHRKSTHSSAHRTFKCT